MKIYCQIVVCVSMLVVTSEGVAQSLTQYFQRPEGLVAEVAGVVPLQTVVGVIGAPAVVVRDASGRPLQGVRVRFSAIEGDWSVEFLGSRFIEVLSDANGIATATAMKPIVTESITAYDRGSQAVAWFNIQASAIDLQTTPFFLLGKMYSTPVTNACGAPAITSNASQPSLRIAPAGLNSVRLNLTNSVEPLRGVDLLDGDRVLYRIRVLEASQLIPVPLGITSLQARFAGTCAIRSADSNILTKSEIEQLGIPIPTIDKISQISLSLLLIGLFASYKVSKHGVRSCFIAFASVSFDHVPSTTPRVFRSPPSRHFPRRSARGYFY